VLTALAVLRAETAYLDGELCGVGDDGLPSFAETQTATDGARGVRLVWPDSRRVLQPPSRSVASSSKSALGGTWSKKERAHAFSEAPA
jgi:hypothetical protein